MYLTRELSIIYRSNDDEVLRSFCDASHAPNLPNKSEAIDDKSIDAHSISGFVVYHRGNLINWGTNKQNTVAVSSTSAEILAISENVDVFLLPGDILCEIFDEKEVMRIHEDNSSSKISLHFSIHFIRILILIPRTDPLLIGGNGPVAVQSLSPDNESPPSGMSSVCRW